MGIVAGYFMFVEEKEFKKKRLSNFPPNNQFIINTTFLSIYYMRLKDAI